MKKMSEIMEGILGDIAKRDLSGKSRKEDDINHLDCYQFLDYFQSNYERIFGGTDTSIFQKVSGTIVRIPVMILGNREKELFIYGVYDEIGLYNVYFILSEQEFNSICDEYPEMKELSKYFRKNTYCISTYKGHKITNKDFIEIIDFCTTISRYKIWKKK